MIYRFKVIEPIAKGASRVGLEQIDIAEARLARRDDAATAIHDTRRCLKRLRALLRLIRPALPDSTYRREANRLAGVGRLLARARDQHVMQLTLVKLGDSFETFPKRIGKQLNKLMANGGGASSARRSSAERRQALEALEQARKFFARLEHRDLTFEHVAAGLRRSYRRARAAFHDAYEKGSDEAFHEWRKTVQQHWRHMQLLSRAWPEVMSGRASEAKELSRLLGEDHDLHVLLVFAAERGKEVLSSEDLATLTTVCQAQQAELRGLARPRGARLFVEPAGDLAQRISHYWRAARDSNAVVHSPEDGARQYSEPAKTAVAQRGRRSAGRRRQAASRGAPEPGSSSREP